MKLTRYIFLVVFAAMFSFMSVGCTMEKVPAGNVGVKVYLLGSDKGVDHEELGVGRYWLGINEELYIFPTFKQNYTWTKDVSEGSKNDESITFQTTEGLSVNADVGITYRIDPAKVNNVFAAYRRGIAEITDTFLRNHVRDAFVTVASVMPVQSVYGTGKRDMVEAVEKHVRAEVGEIGIIIEDIYLLGNLRLPPKVVAALNAKIEATQRAQQRENELREEEAQAQKHIAQARGKSSAAAAQAEGEAQAVLTRAKAQAQANLILSKSITNSLVEYEKIKKWDGKLPQVSGTAGGTLINLTPTK